MVLILFTCSCIIRAFFCLFTDSSKRIKHRPYPLAFPGSLFFCRFLQHFRSSKPAQTRTTKLQRLSSSEQKTNCLKCCEKRCKHLKYKIPLTAHCILAAAAGHEKHLCQAFYFGAEKDVTFI